MTEYQLRIEDIEFKEKLPEKWWKKNNYLKRCLKIVYDSKILDLKYFHRDNYIPTDNLEETLEVCHNVMNDSASGVSFGFSLTSSNKNDLDNAVQFYLTSAFDSMGITISAKPTKANYQKMVKLVWTVYHEFKDIAHLGPYIIISSFMHDYPRHRPERLYGNLGYTAIYNFIDLSYYEKNPHLKPEGVENLSKAALPAGVSREFTDDIVTVQWTEKPADEEAVSQALMQREDWVYKHIKLKIDNDFNEEGDKKLYNISALEETDKAESFFTYYKERLKVAFKPVVLNENLDLDPEVEKNIRYYSNSGQLDNGAEIKKIVLVLPSREHALKINDKAKQLGVFKVVYIDNEVNIWDMFPRGNWRN